MVSHSSFIGISNDAFERFRGIIVKLGAEGYRETIAGKVVDLDDHFLTLEHKDGGHSIVRRDAIKLISPVRAKVDRERRP